MKNELVEMETSLSQVKEENLDRTLELLYEIKNRACSFSELFNCEDYQVKSDVLNSLLWNFGISGQKIVSAEYKLPYAYFKDLNKTRDISVWRREQDSNLR